MDLSKLSSSELLEKLNKNEISVLDRLDAHDLKEEMNMAGFFCKLLADYVCMSKDDSKLRKRTSHILKYLTPAELIKDFPLWEEAIVIGFNHPSLGEIFRLLLIGFEVYEKREFLFPVNIPWYEQMVPIIPKLKRLGITIVPMITPSTEAKLKSRYMGDEDKYNQLQHFKVLFERNYMRKAKEAASKKHIIFVAPSATRQQAVLGEHIHPTMTLLSHMIYKKTENRSLFLPVAVIEPKRNNRRLNLFKSYKLAACKGFEREDALPLSEKSRDFDIAFLLRIDEMRKSILINQKQK